MSQLNSTENRKIMFIYYTAKVETDIDKSHKCFMTMGLLLHRKKFVSI